MNSIRVKTCLNARMPPEKLLEKIDVLARNTRDGRIVLDWEDVHSVPRDNMETIVKRIAEMQKRAGHNRLTFTFSNMNPTLAGFARASSYRNRVRIEVHEPAWKTPRLYEKDQWWHNRRVEQPGR